MAGVVKVDLKSVGFLGWICLAVLMLSITGPSLVETRRHAPLSPPPPPVPPAVPISSQVKYTISVQTLSGSSIPVKIQSLSFNISNSAATTVTFSSLELTASLGPASIVTLHTIGPNLTNVCRLDLVFSTHSVQVSTAVNLNIGFVNVTNLAVGETYSFSVLQVLSPLLWATVNNC